MEIVVISHHFSQVPKKVKIIPQKMLRKYVVRLMYCTKKKREYVLFRFQPTVWICIETWQTDM